MGVASTKWHIKLVLSSAKLSCFKHSLIKACFLSSCNTPGMVSNNLNGYCYWSSYFMTTGYLWQVTRFTHKQREQGPLFSSSNINICDMSAGWVKLCNCLRLVSWFLRCRPLYACTCLSVRLSVRPSICPSVALSVCTSIHPSVRP